MQLISASGDPVTGVGKKIAQSAHLLTPEKTHWLHGEMLDGKVQPPSQKQRKEKEIYNQICFILIV